MNPSPTDNDFLRLAITKAREYVSSGGFPAGAIVVKNGKVISVGINIGHNIHDPTSHGEMAAIRNACASPHLQYPILQGQHFMPPCSRV